MAEKEYFIDDYSGIYSTWEKSKDKGAKDIETKISVKNGYIIYIKGNGSQREKLCQNEGELESFLRASISKNEQAEIIFNPNIAGEEKIREIRGRLREFKKTLSMYEQPT